MNIPIPQEVIDEITRPHREQVAKLTGVPPSQAPEPGSTGFNEDCAFTYSDWMRTRQVVLDRLQRQQEKTKELLGVAQEMVKMLRDNSLMENECPTPDCDCDGSRWAKVMAEAEKLE